MTGLGLSSQGERQRFHWLCLNHPSFCASCGCWPWSQLGQPLFQLWQVGPWLEGMTDMGKATLCQSKGKLFNEETGWLCWWRSLVGTRMLQLIAGWWPWLLGEGRQ